MFVTMSDKKDKDFPDPDELQKMLKDMFGKMGVGATVTMPGFNQQGVSPDSSEGDSSPQSTMRADEVFDFKYRKKDILKLLASNEREENKLIDYYNKNKLSYKSIKDLSQVLSTIDNIL